ncbi:MAG: cellulase family glycosylhydrolase [bacterium]
MTPPAFELGINYWPRRRAMYMWRELDLVEVHDDMQRIAEMGFDTVRLFAMTRDFLPAQNVVDTLMVDRLVEVVRIATDNGVSVVPTLLVINMSGRIWWPEWMLDADGQPGDLYADPALLRAQELLMHTCAKALAGSDRLRAFDVANEIDDAKRPERRAHARAWTSVMTSAIRRGAPGVPVRIGAHLPSLTTANQMRVDDLATVLDEDVMHAYPLYSAVARSYVDPELVPFACALTSALAGRKRGTLMQEFGMCTAPAGAQGHAFIDDFLGTSRTQYLASEDECCTYYETVLARLVETGAAGAYAWCYGDYHAELFGRPPLDTAVRERSFGLIRADGVEKPAVKAFRDLRARRDAGALVVGTVPTVLDVSADNYYADPGGHFARLYARWLAAKT